MDGSKRVKDVMLPLSDYAVVSETATLEDALQALEQSQAKLEADRHPHRAVLVRDGSGTIIGKLDHLAFLKALIPDPEDWRDDEVLTRAGVSDNMLSASAVNLSLFSADAFDVGRRARHVQVAGVSVPAESAIDENASLMDATRAFIERQTLSLLVCRRGAPAHTVGILRLSDLFDELVRQIKSQGADPRNGT
ncbi:MAG: CBS domain-containing protein [Deltaproteobacteria bacterium]|jgi:CBS domain containing-hemolysin-like protein|nr:CBS domain-containing protein [Deltaproteobacteria bacterium]MBW2532035.1 CBS domain-containing protein [Deltaproteobacteria bacterium]